MTVAYPWYLSTFIFRPHHAYLHRSFSSEHIEIFVWNNSGFHFSPQNFKVCLHVTFFKSVSIITIIFKCVPFIVIRITQRKRVRHPFYPSFTPSPLAQYLNDGNNRQGLKTLRINKFFSNWEEDEFPWVVETTYEVILFKKILPFIKACQRNLEK